MADRANVVRGLKSCAHETIGQCGECPYCSIDPHCDIAMMRDALELLGKYHDFCRFVTKEMFDKRNECGECGSAEIYLRKLLKLGYVRLEDDVYSEVEDG